MMNCGIVAVASKPRIFEKATSLKGAAFGLIQLKFVTQLPSRSEPARGVTFNEALAGKASFAPARMIARPPDSRCFLTVSSSFVATITADLLALASLTNG